MTPKERKDLFKKLDGKGKVETNDFRVAYSTGFPTLDAMTKNVINYKGQKITSQGLLTGAYTIIAGESQTGKTTLGANIAANIIKGDENKRKSPKWSLGWIDYFAPENGMELDRLAEICGFSLDDVIEQQLIRPTPMSQTSTEGLEDLIKRTYEFKMENKELFTYETTDIAGNTITEFIPNVVLVDSISMTFPLDSKDLDNEAKNTIYANQNNKNGLALMRCLEYARAVNIMMIFISHVSEKLPINGLPPKRKFKALSGKVNILGGQKLYFTSDLGLFLNKYPNGDLEDLLKTDNLEYAVESICFKNRMGIDGQECVLVNSGVSGFSPLYSLIYDSLTKYDFLKPGGSVYKMEGFEKSFYKKDIANKFLEEEDFRKKFMEHYAKATSIDEELVDKMNQFAARENLILSAMGF